MKQKVKYAY